MPESTDTGDVLRGRSWGAHFARWSGRPRADDARPLLTGVLIAPEGGGIRLVATDSYRLAMRDIDGSDALAGASEILVPARALAELQRLSALGGAGSGRGAGGSRG